MHRRIGQQRLLLVWLMAATSLCSGCADDVEKGIRQLHSSSPSVRSSAAQALGGLGDARAVEPLIACLEDKDESVRRAAAEALGRLGNARAVEPLITCLKDEGEGVSFYAGGALVKLGEPAVAPLIARLKITTAWYQRTPIAETLAKLGKPTVAPLITCLKDSDQGVRCDVAKLLGQLGDARAVEPLITCLKDKSFSGRFCAAQALGQLGDARAVEPLIACLKDDLSEVRRSSAEALGRFRDTRAVEPLIASLKGEDGHVRSSAAEALGELGDPRAVEPLIDYLKYGGRTAAWALAKLGEAAAVPLMACLNDESRSVRFSAAEALGELGDTRAVEPLIASLKDEDGHVRSCAAKALGQLGDKRAIDALVAMMPDWNAKEGLGQALQALAWQPRTPREQVYVWICHADHVELNKHWAETRQVLLSDTVTGRVKLVENALYTIINLGKDEAIGDLVRILYKHGNVPMAETYLNCGYDRLSNAAKHWAAQNGYAVTIGDGSHKAGWGAWR